MIIQMASYAVALVGKVWFDSLVPLLGLVFTGIVMWHGKYFVGKGKKTGSSGFSTTRLRSGRA